MGYQTGIVEALKAQGLRVETVPGWQTRGSSSFAPAGVIAHWTAGPRSATGRPSLAVVTNGRPGLPGPLCQVYLARDGVAVVVAAGRANHAGAGAWNGARGNSSFFGIEAESAGGDDWTDEQRWAYPRVCAALLRLTGRDASWVCGHSEYATPRGRKVDVNGYTPDVLRAQVAQVLAGDIEEDEDMAISEADAELIAAKVWGQPIERQGMSANAASWLGDTRILAGYAAAEAADDGAPVDPQALAAALAPLLTQNLRVLSQADLEALAKATADELHSRLAG